MMQSMFSLSFDSEETEKTYLALIHLGNFERISSFLYIPTYLNPIRLSLYSLFYEKG
jgi:hypothetical protein